MADASFARIGLGAGADGLASAPLKVSHVVSPPLFWQLGTCAPRVSVATQPGAALAPLLPGLAGTSRAPLQIRSRRHARIVVGVAASLLAHAALAALAWRTPTPAPQTGLVELTIVYAGDEMEQPAGEISLPLETEPPEALPQELVEASQVQKQKVAAPQQEPEILQPPSALVAIRREVVEPAARPVVAAPASQAHRKPAAQKARADGRAVAASRGAQVSATAPPHYLTAVFARVQRAKRYPVKAQTRGDQGRAVVSISIRRNGALAQARLVRSSGSSLLDEATLDAVRRAAPYPALPPEVGGSVLVLTVPMNFTME